ncbi:heavy metal-associated isoprenylated plant protein 37-like isoform X2 [Actinidia eriantha]|uniref:heavy metal-associated isoprenylated plant protein 37-like isoform X2 n=1 Tax=Actinidia eriantha TaxID=165200 RepID=UPI0025890DC2|nr:heavy metal-associated isoprenylated plant protein 37-like isoform X2 [Actinidia eriantha]
MTKNEDFKLLKIQTCVLKVNIHCDGCKQTVKKILQRIEGVYQVNIDAEQQKVTVSGSVDSATLIKKLVRSGKHAEIWSNHKTSQNQNQNQNQKPNNNCMKNDKKTSNKKGPKQGLVNNFPALFTSEDDDGDDEDGDDEEDELRFIREKANQLNQLGLLRQQSMNPNSASKGNVYGKIHNNVGIGIGIGNGNQNMGIKANPGLKLNNSHLGGGNSIPGVGRMGSDISSMMGLAGFHGNGANSVLGGHPFHPNSGYPSSVGMNTNGYDPSASSVMMNLHNRQPPQPQMMYQRSPYIPPATGFYYNYNYSPVPYTYSEPNYSSDHSHSASHEVSEENTTTCSIM